MILNRKKFHSIVTGTPALNAVSKLVTMAIKIKFSMLSLFLPHK